MICKAVNFGFSVLQQIILIISKCIVVLCITTFRSNDKIHFFEYMDRLKHSNIPIDNDMLELIRTFS